MRPIDPGMKSHLNSFRIVRRLSFVARSHSDNILP